MSFERVPSIKVFKFFIHNLFTFVFERLVATIGSYDLVNALPTQYLSRFSYRPPLVLKPQKGNSNIVFFLGIDFTN
jgi:hypothetical protein